jgi:cysteine synthase A
MSLLHLIGNTPIIVVDGIHIKCEFLNPTGSSKDRIAYEMLMHERRNIIIEVSSGNTGISVAFVCAALGKGCILFVPQTTSLYKVRAMQAYGASVSNNHRDLADAMNCAAALMDSSTTMRLLNQFANQANVSAQTKMAQEIEQFDIKPDCIICGIGTSGTLAGLHRIFPDARSR